MMLRANLQICCFVVLTLSSCMSLPRPTPAELKARDAWAALLPPDVRQKVIDEANRHTNWTEKRRVQFEIERFQHLHRDQERKTRATQPSTRPAAHPQHIDGKGY